MLVVAGIWTKKLHRPVVVGAIHLDRSIILRFVSGKASLIAAQLTGRPVDPWIGPWASRRFVVSDGVVRCRWTMAQGSNEVSMVFRVFTGPFHAFLQTPFLQCR